MLDATMLVISDDPTLIETMSGLVRSIEDLKIATLDEMEKAHSYAAWDRVALVLIHMKRSGLDSEVTRLLRMISRARRPVATLVVADHQDADQALSLLRLGVVEYLGRPLDMARLSHLAEVLTFRVREASQGPGESLARPPRPLLGTELSWPTLDESPDGEDPLMGQIRRVAPHDATILLGGETGTGKTRLAHWIHDLSSRRAEPFVVINCGSMNEAQIEGDLFGHARGSTDNLKRERAGKIAEAGRGTLFLDEIDALPLGLQLRLLRVVEDRVFEPIGSYTSLPIRARLIAASNRNLEHEMEAERFRSDLYFRLNVIGFELPPLRECRSTIPALVARFIAESSSLHGGLVESISDAALQVLKDYPWPGNIRELKNTIERTVVLSPGREIEVGDLPEAITRRDLHAIKRGIFQHTPSPVPTESTFTLAEIKRDAEFARITEALEKHSNNRLRAASELGISRMTLYKKLYKYGLMHPNPSERRNEI